MNVKEVAQELNRCEETIRRWTRDGKIKAIQNSRKEGYIYNKRDVKLFAIRNGLSIKREIV